MYIYKSVYLHTHFVFWVLAFTPCVKIQNNCNSSDADLKPFLSICTPSLASLEML